MQYSIINCGHHAVHYIPLTYLFIAGILYILTTFTHFAHLPLHL